MQIYVNIGSFVDLSLQFEKNNVEMDSTNTFSSNNQNDLILLDDSTLTLKCVVISNNSIYSFTPKTITFNHIIFDGLILASPGNIKINFNVDYLTFSGVTADEFEIMITEEAPPFVMDI